MSEIARMRMMATWQDYEIERDHQIKLVQKILANDLKEPATKFSKVATEIVDKLLGSEFTTKGENDE